MFLPISGKMVKWFFTAWLALFVCASSLAQEGRKAFPVGNTINSAADELCPLFSADGNTLFFVRSVSPQNKGGKRGGQDIWFAKRMPDGSWGQAINAGNGVNNKNNNLLGGFSNDMQRMYIGNRMEKAAPGILCATLENTHYGKPETVIDETHMPTRGYFSFYVHPSETILVASMDREGNGNEDIYYALKQNNAWGDWIKFPLQINTDGFETSPWLSADGRKLFYSSNGRAGYGEGDIFCSDRVGSGWNKWTTGVNLGSDVNTQGFDAYFSVSSDGKTAVFSSGENAGANADVYMMPMDQIPAVQAKDTVRFRCMQGDSRSGKIAELLGKKECNYFNGARSWHQKSLLEAAEQPDFLDYHPNPDYLGFDTLSVSICKSRDKQTCDSLIVIVEITEFIEEVNLLLVNKQNGDTLDVEPMLVSADTKKQIPLTQTGKGRYQAKVKPGQPFTVVASTKGFFDFSEAFQANKAPQKTTYKTLALTPLLTGNTITLRNILFETAKADLKPSSSEQLDKLLYMMQNNPEVAILISGHTDNAGSAASNQKLSERRVQSVGAYLRSKGIASKRILTKGFGSSKPVADNNTEEGKQLNRRVEITIR
jgi:outer membrane protein OmpA-like peptidoglycan-associated protein